MRKLTNITVHMRCIVLHLQCGLLNNETLIQYFLLVFQKLSLQNKELEAENSRLQESLIELKDQNEKIQKVVGNTQNVK